VLTNQSSGESLRNDGTVMGKDIHVTDNGDGTLTVVRLNTGNVNTYDESGKAVASSSTTARTWGGRCPRVARTCSTNARHAGSRRPMAPVCAAN
jgi:hypothetical protein